MCPQRFTSHPTNPSNPSIHPKCHYMALWVPVSKNGEYLFTQTSPQNSERDKHYQNIKYGEMNTEQACLSIFTKFHPPQILTVFFSSMESICLAPIAIPKMAFFAACIFAHFLPPSAFRSPWLSGSIVVGALKKIDKSHRGEEGGRLHPHVQWTQFNNCTMVGIVWENPKGFYPQTKKRICRFCSTFVPAHIPK